MTKAKTSDEKPEKPSQIVDGKDARLLVDVFIPGHEPFRTDLTIRNIVGNTRPPQRNPFHFRWLLISALQSKFGKSVE